jgi:hypothetical protein
MSVGEDPHDIAETLNREMRKKLLLRCRCKEGPIVSLNPDSLRSPWVEIAVGSNVIIWPGHGLVKDDEVSFFIGRDGTAPPELPISTPCRILKVMDTDRFSIFSVADQQFSCGGSVWVLPAKEHPPGHSRWVQIAAGSNEIFWPGHDLREGDEVSFDVGRNGIAPPELPISVPCQVLKVVDRDRFSIADRQFSAAAKNVWVVPTKELTPKVLPIPYIATTLLLVVESDAAGRWRAEIIPTQPVSFKYPWHPYAFEFETAGVVQLLPQEALPRARSGPAPRGSWPELTRQKLRRIGINHARELENSGELQKVLEEHLDDEIRWHPADPKSIRAIIRDFLRVSSNSP